MKTNTFLLGATGSGKTYCLRTLLDCGVTPFIISTEPGVEATLGDLPPEKCHWHYVAPATQSWSDLITSAERINQLSFESLAKMSDINKRSYSQYLDFLKLCNNFTCQRDGKEYGDVAEWDTSRALVVDSLSGLSIMAMNLVVGSKPTKSQADWGVAMDNLERTIITLVTGTRCHFILTGHLEREHDEVTGGVQLMASTLGRKLAPKLPRFFDEVVLCKRDGTKFNWSTAAFNTDLKARRLPIADTLPPTFTQIIKES